jgi:DNA-binding transcriptional LysR family regulator
MMRMAALPVLRPIGSTMDLRLLAVFDEVYKTRSVSRAADNLGLPQTTVSLALARMRRQFNDALFVRTAAGMVPTPQAEELAQPLRDALELLRTATRHKVVFDPALSSRTFRISMTDISHLEFLPRLVNKVGRLAPGVRIDVLRIDAGTPHALEVGASDLAVGFMPELEAGFYQQTLFSQSFACVVRKGHPRVKGTLTAAAYRREKHVVVTAPGTGHEIVELELKRLGIERSIALSVPTLPGLGNLLANTELVATVPERVAQMLTGIARVQSLPVPWRMPRFAIKQHWHQRFQQDPANRWLRSVVAELFVE